MIRFTWLLLLMVLVTACQSQLIDGSTPTSQDRPTPTEAGFTQGSAPDSPGELVPAPELPTPVLTSTSVGETLPAVEPTPIETEEIPQRPTGEAVPPTKEPPLTPAAVVNGMYEGTYFRGLESAKVTMFDYSDFL